MRALLRLNFVYTMETHQHRKIAAFEGDYAYLNGWISKEELLKAYEDL